MQFQIILVAILIAKVSITFSQNLVYVTPSGDVSCTDSTCGDKSNPCPNIACAFDLAPARSVIVLMKGTFSGSNVNNTQLTPLRWKNLVLVGEGGPEETIVDCMTSDSTPMKVFHKAQRFLTIEMNSISRISNMTITNCNSDLNIGDLFPEENLSPALVDRIFVEIRGNNGAYRNFGGAALLVGNSTLHIDNVHFSNNIALRGAIFGYDNSSLIIKNSMFSNNTAQLHGGAVASDESSVSISWSHFVGNRAIGLLSDGGNIQGFGGSVYFSSLLSGKHSFQSYNNVYQYNSASRSGGSLYLQSASMKPYSITTQGDLFEFNGLSSDGNCFSLEVCNIRGGAIYVSGQSALISRSIFNGNYARSELASSEFSEGGAVFSSNLIEIKDKSGDEGIFNVTVSQCSFTNNSASVYGGALYVINQRLSLDKTNFTDNSAGDGSQLFLDIAAAGGAVWYSDAFHDGFIDSCNFSNNIVWGGWGGAIYLTVVPNNFTIKNSQFISNEAVSSYTFQAQGGALKAANELILVIIHCLFQENVAHPVTIPITSPLTFSGAGGALFLQSVVLDAQNCQFERNLALTGQFDAGSSGGAVQAENSALIFINGSRFSDNGAAGYFGYSTYASSGSGGGILLKFSSAYIAQCHFEGNWVTVGGTQVSTGGAIAAFFEYKGTSIHRYSGVQIISSNFTGNTALSQTCYQTGTRSGEGGAIVVVGITSEVSINNCMFTRNAADSPALASSASASFGGALAVTVGSNVTMKSCLFSSNMAKHGLGNDIASVTGVQQGVSNLKVKSSAFYALSAAQAEQMIGFINDVNSNICSTLAVFFRPGSGHHRALQNKRSLQSEILNDLRNKIANVEETIASIELNPNMEPKLWPVVKALTVFAQYKSELKAEIKSIVEYDAKMVYSVFSQSADEFYPRRRLVSLHIDFSFIAPAIVVNNGFASFSNPAFTGDYHIIFGDVGFIVAEGTSTGSEPLPRFALSCTGSIYSTNPSLLINSGLIITAIGATVLVANIPSPVSAVAFKGITNVLSLTEVHLYNSTFFVSNNLTVSGNCTIDSSTISALTSSALALLPPKLLPILLPFITSSTPIINFRGPVYTGTGKVSNGLSPFFAKDDDDSGVSINPNQRISLVACIMVIFKALQVTTVDDPDGSLASNNQEHYVFFRLTNEAQIIIYKNAIMNIFAHTFIVADLDTSPAILNNGTINLSGSLGSTAGSLLDSETLNFNEISQSNVVSLQSPLSVYGTFAQTASASIFVTLNTSFQSVPVLTMSSNKSFLGTLYVGFSGSPQLTFYDGSLPSSFSIASYKSVTPLAHGKSINVISSNPGISFTSSVTLVKDESTGTEVYTQTAVVSAIACANILEYYANIQSLSSTFYPCYVCLQNTSCNYCNGKCMDAGMCPKTADGSQVYSESCCDSNCNYPNGYCEPVDGSSNSRFTCNCNQFYDSSTCANLSLESIMLITASVFFVTFSLITFLYYRYSKGQKSVVLEELRQGLLYNTENSTTDPEYIRAMQQALILKDVFVRYEEIKIESQIGEGSFGVVYKATFRGAQVAVKQMRSMFLELTENDIEGFRKEAYMMSRLRHPNIVLVMGISLLDTPAPVKGLKALRDDFDDKSIKSDKEKDGPSKTICIITEYLEQGSLADILYGPHKLPAEIWSYELVLTCCLQAARGMLYLHSHSPQICHRDLKSSNLVVDDHWVVKVTDFGMSRIVPEKVQDFEKGLNPNINEPMNDDRPSLSVDKKRNQSSDRSRSKSAEASVASSFLGSSAAYSNNSSFMNSNYSQYSSMSGSSNRFFHGVGPSQSLEMTSNLGTTAWCAPELLTVRSTTSYSVKVDVYSFGMVLWEIWEKKRPFEEFSSRFDIIDAILAGKRPEISESCPPAYRSLIQRCWTSEPTRRPNFQYIVRFLKDELARVKRQRTAGTQGGLGLSGRDSNLSIDLPGSFLLTANKSMESFVQKLSNFASPAGKLEGSNNSNKDDRPTAITSSDAVNRMSNNSNNGGSNQLFWSRGRPSNSSGSVTSGPAENPSRDPRDPLIHASSGTLAHLAASPMATSSTAASAGVTANPAGRARPSHRSNVWRDNYVLKFSGWKASQPDSGLPPSLTTMNPIISSAAKSPSGSSIVSGMSESEGNFNATAAEPPSHGSTGVANVPSSPSLLSHLTTAALQMIGSSQGPDESQSGAETIDVEARGESGSSNEDLIEDGIFSLDGDENASMGSAGSRAGSFTTETAGGVTALKIVPVRSGRGTSVAISGAAKGNGISDMNNSNRSV